MQLPTNDDAHPAAERFRDFLHHGPFYCVGARTAPSRGRMKMIVARDIRSGWDDTRIDPARLAVICRNRAQPSLYGVPFGGHHTLSEDAFETDPWDRVQTRSDKDQRPGQTCDPRVASDPEDPPAAPNLGGEGFSLVGLHPGASRRARRFAAPARVFDRLGQFARLPAEERYQRLPVPAGRGRPVVGRAAGAGGSRVRRLPGPADGQPRSGR